MMHTHSLTRALDRPTVAALAALALAAPLACRDGTGPSPQPATAQYDLVFDGEDALGRRQLYRAPLDGTAPSLIGGGIEAIKPAPSPDGWGSSSRRLGCQIGSRRPRRPTASSRGRRTHGGSPSCRSAMTGSVATSSPPMSPTADS